MVMGCVFFESRIEFMNIN